MRMRMRAEVFAVGAVRSQAGRQRNGASFVSADKMEPSLIHGGVLLCYSYSYIMCAPLIALFMICANPSCIHFILHCVNFHGSGRRVCTLLI